MRFRWTKQILAMLAIFSSIGSTAQLTWRRAHGGFGSDVGYSVRHTLDGGYIICGATGSFGQGGGDVYLLKLDSDGHREWSKTFGGSGVEQASSVRQLPDGGFLVIGATNSFGAGGYDGYAVRTTYLGDLVWEETFGSGDWDLLYSFEIDPDGEFIAVGETYSTSSGEPDGWLIRIGELGNAMWQMTYGGDALDYFRAVHPITGGGYVMAGGTQELGTMDAWVVEVDALGVVNWSAIDGGDSLDHAEDIVPTLDGGYSVLGTTESYSEWTEMYHYKLDASGAFLWYKHWGQTGNQEGYEHLELIDGRLVSIGYNAAVGAGGKDYYILTSDQMGEFIQGTSYGGSEDEVEYSLDRTTDGGYVLAGLTESWGYGVQDIWVVKVDSALQPPFQTVEEWLDPLTIHDPASQIDVSIWPSPVAAGGTLYIRCANLLTEVRLCDITGRELLTKEVGNAYEVAMDLRTADLATGTYMLLLGGADWRSTARVLVVDP